MVEFAQIMQEHKSDLMNKDNVIEDMIFKRKQLEQVITDQEQRIKFLTGQLSSKQDRKLDDLENASANLQVTLKHQLEENHSLQTEILGLKDSLFQQTKKLNETQSIPLPKQIQQLKNLVAT